MEVFTIHTDGAARGNPGPAAYAFTIERQGQPPIEAFGVLGDRWGRVRTMLLTIVLYSLFTGLNYFARQPGERTGTRFPAIQALAIGLLTLLRRALVSAPPQPPWRPEEED